MSTVDNAGDVTVLHGDCRELLPTLGAESISAIVTDPPYGIDYGTPFRAQKSTKRSSTFVVEWGGIAGDKTPDGDWLADAFRVMREGAAIYVMTRWDVEPEWRRMLKDAGFRINQRLTWHKRDHGKGDLKGTYATTCEDVLFASKGRHILNHRPSMLLDVGCVPTWEKRFHPHQKPVALPKALIEASTKHGDIVLDPFAGSGTTGVACMKTGRRAILIESAAKYIPLIQHRLQAAETPLFAGLEEGR